ncbi:MAG: FAD-dependent oxidoreductase [Chloroflexi bacterium]|nr:FAD-dependent oxidoreductase [Chloroflexota bacterium]
MPVKAWKCNVCGYIHRGEEPPEWCPVCGSPREEFEPYVEAAPAAAAPAPGGFRCLVCNYLHLGAAPPAQCPVCGTHADRFEAAQAPPPMVGRAGTVGRVLIVGAGIAGLAAAEALRSASPDVRVTLFSKESELPYYRLNLTRFLAGEIAESDLPIHPAEWYEEQRLGLRLGSEVTHIDPVKGSLQTKAGGEIEFDRLILTAGAHPFVPPIVGAYREGVTSLRTVQDTRRILAAIGPGAKVVCVGGGVLGLEAAGGLSRRGAQVSVLEGYGWVLPRQLNRDASAILERFLGRIGISVVKQAKTAEILGDERARGVRLEDGTVLPADLVIFATGVRPNSYLARLAGLQVNQGIVVDDFLCTSQANIFAAGDVAEHRGVSYGIWLPAKSQGSIAGLNALGAQVEFGGIPRSNTLKVLGLDLFSIGKVEPEDGSYTEVEAEEDGNYARFLFHDSHLVGAILLGNAKQSADCKRAIEGKADFSQILAGRPSAAEILESLAELR